MTETDNHLGELKLRRLWAGESLGADADAVQQHTAACPQCRARLKDFDDQQRRFQDEISFDRFAAGVERAARRPAAPARQRPGGVRWLVPALGMAAALALTVSFAARPDPSNRVNRTKGGGGSGVTVRIAAPERGTQRSASADTPEALSAGERIRIGYQPGAHRFLTAISVDDAGAVTALYPESGRSVTVPRGAETRYLPDSVEFTGKGAERLVVVLSDEPLEMEAVKRAAHAAYGKAKGDILHLPSLEIKGEQFHRSFLKP
ncbi:MAG TPA: ACP synthase [Polyangia bacterium]|jgi:hypothetical protein|nr:ACP synthase [Polyangia bacterium]